MPNELDIPNRLNGLDLFSGIGGITLALEPWVRPVAYCENDRYAQAVLLSRMVCKQLPIAPIWDDVRTLTSRMVPSIDIIYGGFPCQDISVAGHGIGLEGERSGLIFELFRLVRECRPKFVFLENVPALTVRGLDRILLEFHALGYDARWTIVSAAEMGAPHLRERIWILAHSNGHRGRIQPECESKFSDSRIAWNESEEVYPDSLRTGRQRWIDAGPAWETFRLGSGIGSEAWPQWLPQPAIHRSDDGFPNRMDALRGLGNAVVPQAAREAFKRLAGLE